ncbi:MAG TPA: lamin tail domain-containing protein [Candidatus Kapabacteria bacterium]|nr:lamin tail domain-containing protein [Candidatus Kapabacteria bacterium]
MIRIPRRIAIVFFIIIVHSGLRAQPKIVINELMYAPKSPEPEWVELFNFGTDSIDLTGWHISNHSRTEPFSNISIAPNSFLVITHDSAKLVTKHSSIPSRVVQMTMPSLNNSGDSITLRDSTNRIIDQVDYLPSWGGANGRSLERIEELLPSDASNFSESVDSAGATPGRINSVRRKNFDVAAYSIKRISYTSTNATLRFIFQNRGRQAVTNIPYTLYRAGGSVPVTTGFTTHTVAPLEFDTVTFDWADADLGYSALSLITSYPGDENLSNDTTIDTIYIPIPQHAIVINELMITPAFSYSEWIELYNQTNNRCDLTGTIITIPNIDSIHSYSVNSLHIAPKSFGVIAASSRFTAVDVHPTDNADTVHTTSFHLLPSGSSVIFLNADSSLIDGVSYDASFLSNNISSLSGISLERKHPDGSSTDKINWGSCVAPAGSTPFAPNSITFDSANSFAAISVNAMPNPFSPDNDGFEDISRITITAPTDAEQTVTVRIYDCRSRMRRSISESMRFVRELQMDFDGKDDHGVPLESGLYTMITQTGTSTSRKGIVIVKRK